MAARADNKYDMVTAGLQGSRVDNKQTWVCVNIHCGSVALDDSDLIIVKPKIVRT